MSEDLITDDELLYMIHQKDEPAMEMLMQRYRPMIKGLIRQLGQLRHCSISGDAFQEDLEQESRIMLMSAIDSYREDCSCTFKTYLYNCIRKRLLTIYRHSQCAKEMAFYGCDSLDTLVSEDHAVYRCDMVESTDRFFDPVYCLQLNEASERLKQLRLHFTPREWKILCLSLNGTSYQSAAEQLGCTKKSYGNQLSRIRKKLNNLIEKMA